MIDEKARAALRDKLHLAAREAVTKAVAQAASREHAANRVEFLSRQEVMRRYGISDRTLRRGVAEGSFPPPLVVFRPRWRLADLEAWEAARREAQEGPPEGEARPRGRPAKLRRALPLRR